jgi:solute carrier family 66 (lysosomal lysine-arginine transporter), member 1
VLSLVPSSSPESIRESDYIPSKSVEPEILDLNLRILELIESCRTVPLLSPSSTTTTVTTIPTTPSVDIFSPEKFTEVITKSQKLGARVDKLTNVQDIADFRIELQNIMYLLAVPIPEKGPAAHYLEQARRQAVADQINSAILCVYIISCHLIYWYTNTSLQIEQGCQ